MPGLCATTAAGVARRSGPRQAVSARRLRRQPAAAGVPTDGWFADRMSLCLLGVTATFAWEKARGSDAELGWSAAAMLRGARCSTAVDPSWR